MNINESSAFDTGKKPGFSTLFIYGLDSALSLTALHSYVPKQQQGRYSSKEKRGVRACSCTDTRHSLETENVALKKKILLPSSKFFYDPLKETPADSGLFGAQR